MKNTIIEMENTLEGINSRLDETEDQISNLNDKVAEKTQSEQQNALAGVAQWIECRLQTKGSPVRFPVRAHAWVAGQVPRGGHVRGNHTLTSLSPSPSPSSPLSLKINT